MIASEDTCESLPQEAIVQRPSEQAAKTTMKSNQSSGTEGRPRRNYDEDYKRHAVALTLQGQRTIKAIAQELGVAESMLYDWRKRYVPRPGHESTHPQNLEQAQQEIARLRGELVRMQEREVVLKKSLGILSETPASGLPKSMR
jgi:transposase